MTAKMQYPDIFNKLKVNKQILRYKSPFSDYRFKKIVQNFFTNATCIEVHEAGEVQEFTMIGVYRFDEYKDKLIVMEVKVGSCEGCSDYEDDRKEWLERQMDRLYIDDKEVAIMYVKKLMDNLNQHNSTTHSEYVQEVKKWKNVIQTRFDADDKKEHFLSVVSDDSDEN